jgi:hypothetical protein
MKKHKTLFDEVSSQLSDQRKQAKLQLLQDRGERNGGNLNSVRGESHRDFRNQKR